MSKTSKATKLLLKILIFCRYPLPGQVKTRLIPALGEHGAARLQRRMSEMTTATARRFKRELESSEVDAAERDIVVGIRVCFTGAKASDFRAWLGDDLEYQRQAAGELGARMRQALELAFQPRFANQSCDGLECGIPVWERKTERDREIALVVGSDLPELDTNHLHLALAQLKKNDLVLGPAADGGYYLLGVCRPQPELFRDIPWGGAEVLEQTLAIARRLGLKHALLPTLSDMDRPQDLARLPREDFSDFIPSNQGETSPLLSVIIPTLNEESFLEATLKQLRLPKEELSGAGGGRGKPGPQVEPIVVDGGSTDATVEIARRLGVRVITANSGRGEQLNAGARAARGRLLLFLHADTLLPSNYQELIHQALEDPATVCGSFRLQIHPTLGSRDNLGDIHTANRVTGPLKTALLKLIAMGANIRSRLLKLPYGDQGVFMEKRVFEEIGGFPPLPIMEDYALIRRLGRRGGVAILPQAVKTSARRWLQRGIIRTFLINQLMVLGYKVGFEPDRLASFYRNCRNRSPGSIIR